jgi:hypothetical protein
MMNKRGAEWGLIFLIGIIGLVLVAAFFSDNFDFFPDKENFNLPAKGFEEIITVKGQPVNSLSVLNYIFGKVPGYLIQIVDNNRISAAIIIFALWVIFFLIFADIMKLYGGFSSTVNWVVAALLAVVGANLKIISVVMVYFLTILSVFGAFAVILAIAAIFGIFVLFHFGSQSLRRKLLIRRAQDAGMRALAGGEKAAAGIAVAKKMAEEAAK